MSRAVQSVGFVRAPVIRPSTTAAGSTAEGGRILSLEDSFQEGFSMHVHEDVVKRKEWDFKSRSNSEKHPFSFPGSGLDRVWRRAPSAAHASPYKPWAPELGTASLGAYRSSYPSDSCNFSSVDIIPTQAHRSALIGPATAEANLAASSSSSSSSATSTSTSSSSSSTDASPSATANTSTFAPRPLPHGRPSVIRPPPPPPSVPRPSTAPLVIKPAHSAAPSHPASLLLNRGRDASRVPVGYRLIERGGTQTFQDVRVPSNSVAFSDLALVKQFKQDIERKEQEWTKAQAEANAFRSSSSSSSEHQSSSTQQLEATVRLPQASRNEGRAPPPHPMWKTTYLTYGHLTEEQLQAQQRQPQHRVFFPRLQAFSNSFQHCGPYRSRGLNCHVDKPPLDPNKMNIGFR